jgi:hypothetical protein
LTRRVVAAAILSLVPWAVFFVAFQTTPTGMPNRQVLDWTFNGATFFLTVIALPSFAPLLAAPTAATRLGVAVVMSTVAWYAAAAIVRTDDAQAGLAVLTVPMVAIPLAVVIAAATALARARHTSRANHA